jgi:hypothetical protein
MSINPLKAGNNRANEIKSVKGDLKRSVTLFDIDYAMMTYLEDTVLPTLSDSNGTALKIPVIYGNSERWKGARRDGAYRDIHGKIQLPLMMIRRTSIAKDETMPMQNRHVTYPTITKYSKDNRYDRFSALGGGARPKYELFNIVMPDYVEVNYECMVWTSFTEQLNEVIEHLNFTSSYWGDKEKYKFRASVSEFNVINEVGEGAVRINRVEFSLNVKAYLLPETFDGEMTTKKSMSIKRVVVATETDVTGNGRLEGMLTTTSPYYDNKDLIDFLSLNNSKVSKPITNNTITFSGIKLIKAPTQLESVVSSGISVGGQMYDIKVYINGTRYYQTSHFTVGITLLNNLTINFIQANLGFTVDTNDEIIITGKFIDIT